ncbi:unnamed protein product, partial [Phaeothamnion confervicola]
YTLKGVTATEVTNVKWDSTITHCRPNICTGAVDCHTHTNGVNAGGTTFAGKLTPPGHAMPSSMILTATVTPKTGAAYDINAETTAMQYKPTVQAAVGNAVQAGWPIEVVDVNTCYSPCTVPYMAKIASDLSAQDVLYRGGKVYGFTNWSVKKASGTTTQVGGNIPITENGMTLTAAYAAMVGVTDNKANVGPALATVEGLYGYIEVTWTVPAAGGYDWALISVTSADGTDRSTAALMNAKTATVGVAVGAKAYSVTLFGYNS